MEQQANAVRELFALYKARLFSERLAQVESPELVAFVHGFIAGVAMTKSPMKGFTNSNTGRTMIEEIAEILHQPTVQ